MLFKNCTDKNKYCSPMRKENKAWFSFFKKGRYNYYFEINAHAPTGYVCQWNFKVDELPSDNYAIELSHNARFLLLSKD